MNKILIVAFFVLITFGQSYPNFRILNIQGGNVFSPKNTHASVIEENVKIKLYRDTCRVTCKFWIKSEQEDETLNIAFPNSLSDYSFGFPQTSGVECFSVYVDGKLTKHKKTKDSTLSFGKFHDNSWFVFTLNIKKNKVHTIECTYRDTWYGLYEYLIGTGVTWNGPIGKGRIVFDFSSVCSKLFIKEPTTYNQFHDPAFPEKIIGKIVNDSVVYSFQNYRPDSSEIVSLWAFNYWGDSLKAEYLDTIPLDNDPSGILFYGYKNSFMYEYLSDTVNYKHGYNFQAIKDEVFSRTKSFYANKFPQKISAKDKITISILSANLDSLKNDLLATNNLEASIAFDSFFVNTKCNDKEKNNKAYTDIVNDLCLPYEEINKFKNVYRNNIKGTMEIIGYSHDGFLIDSINFIGNKYASSAYSIMAERMGLLQGRMLFDNNNNCESQFIAKLRIWIGTKTK